ncbi:MAG TPA: ribbon-helix-helix protein, CopG family [Dehalococcoidales bacterium]|jgi:metal-responsive CopG/Arc/MetJ family transcriptional regulator
MSRTSKIAISLPEDILNAVEEKRGESGESRSQFFRRAVEALLKLQRERDQNERYIRAYSENPETEQEIEAARHAASTILAREPWDEKG